MDTEKTAYGVRKYLDKDVASMIQSEVDSRKGTPMSTTFDAVCATIIELWFADDSNDTANVKAPHVKRGRAAASPEAKAATVANRLDAPTLAALIKLAEGLK